LSASSAIINQFTVTMPLLQIWLEASVVMSLPFGLEYF
jgi:hypothetical protein